MASNNKWCVGGGVGRVGGRWEVGLVGDGRWGWWHMGGGVGGIWEVWLMGDGRCTQKYGGVGDYLHKQVEDERLRIFFSCSKSE